MNTPAEFLAQPLAQTLDAAILKPEMSRAEVLDAARLCFPHRPKTLCVRPADIPLLKEACRQHGVGLCVVLAFPHGDALTASKADEARRYIDLGVDEIDMVANFGWIRSGDDAAVEGDIAAVTAVTRPAGVPLKVIFETVHLHEALIRKTVDSCVRAGADFVKTSTGFNGEGASVEAVRIMLEQAAGRIQVKPSGGIRNREQAEAFLRMGATRLGVGFGSVPAICGDAPAAKNGY